MPIHGACLCGQVKITIEGIEDDGQAKGVGLCHCSDCQSTGGTFFCSAVHVPNDSLHIEGPLNSYESTSSIGKTVNRKSCSTCFSWISFSSPLFPDKTSVMTGNLAGYKNIKVDYEIFTKNRVAGMGEFEGARQWEGLPMGRVKGDAKM